MRLIDNMYDVADMTVDGQRCTATVTLRPDCDIYRAHFPGQPVTPGVCIIGMATELASSAFGTSMRLSVVRNAKFIAVIDPHATPAVTYDITARDSDGDDIQLTVTVTAPSGQCLAKLSLMCRKKSV